MDPDVKRQLDLRLAKGEITRDEYSATLKALTEGDKSAGSSSVFSQVSGAFNDWLNCNFMKNPARAVARAGVTKF